MKKITIITNNIYSFGGGERWALEIYKKIRRSNKVCIAYPSTYRDLIRIKKQDLYKNYYIKKEFLYKINCFKPRRFELYGNLVNIFIPTFWGIVGLEHLIKNSDSVYCLSSNPLILIYSILFSRIYKKRFIYGVHNPVFSNIFGSNKTNLLGWFYRVLGDAVLKKADVIHTLNYEDYSLAKKTFKNVKVYMIPNFLYKRASRIHVNHKSFVLLFVGRPSHYEKGLDFLEKIINNIAGTNKEIMFSIIGIKYGEDGGLDLLSKKYGNVKLMGFLSLEDLNREYANGSVLISTSRKETFGLSILEAQNRGLPVITFDSGGPSGIIKASVQGKVIKKFEVNAFAKEIIKYYKLWKHDKNTYYKTKLRISNLIIGRYNAKIIVPKIVDMICGGNEQ